MIYIVIVAFGLSSIVLAMASYWSFAAGSTLIGCFTGVMAAMAVSVVIKSINALLADQKNAATDSQENVLPPNTSK